MGTNSPSAAFRSISYPVTSLPLSLGGVHEMSMYSVVGAAFRVVMSSGGARSSECTESELSDGVRSNWSELKLAEKSRSPAAASLTSTTTAPFADSPTSSVPRLQVTLLPDPLHWPEGVADTKLEPASRVPVNRVEVEAEGPLLLTDQS